MRSKGISAARHEAMGEEFARAHGKVVRENVVELCDFNSPQASRVGDKMKNVLKPLEYEFLKSAGKSIRWRNAAQWARNTMVNEDGRMVKNGKNGVWEISDKGRKWLSSPRV